MELHGGDTWGHIAPMFHLVDVFAVYAVTFLGGRHVMLPAFSPKGALDLIGAPHASATYLLHANISRIGSDLPRSNGKVQPHDSAYPEGLNGHCNANCSES